VLVRTVEAHFGQEEEALLSQRDLASLAHLNEHVDLANKMRRLRDDWRIGAHAVLDHRTLVALARWWITHICSRDIPSGMFS
jgi:hemerythrin